MGGGAKGACGKKGPEEGWFKLRESSPPLTMIALAKVDSRRLGSFAYHLHVLPLLQVPRGAGWILEGCVGDGERRRLIGPRTRFLGRHQGHSSILGTKLVFSSSSFWVTLPVQDLLGGAACVALGWSLLPGCVPQGFPPPWTPITMPRTAILVTGCL